MTDTALADMTDGSTAQATDIIYAVRDPGGTPLNRKLTIANVRAYLLAQANTWAAANTFAAATASDTPIIGKGAASQTAPLQKWVTSADVTLTSILASGGLDSNDTAATTTSTSSTGAYAHRFRSDVGGSPSDIRIWRGRMIFDRTLTTGPLVGMGDPGGAEISGYYGDGFGRPIGSGYAGLWGNHSCRLWAGPFGAAVLSDGMLGWSPNTNPSSTPDTGTKRAAAAVISLEGASSVGGTLRAVPRRATQITADQNNYAPGGTSLLQFWSSDAARSVTGLSLSQVDGQQHEVWNIGSNNIVLVHQSASSTAANRFLTTTGADLTLSSGQMAFLRYDNTQARWLAVKGT